MTDKELMRMALNALEGADQIDIDMRDAIVTLKARFKQAEKQKPVAWLHRMDNTEGIKSNGKGIVLIDQYRRHPFGLVGVDFLQRIKRLLQQFFVSHGLLQQFFDPFVHSSTPKFFLTTTAPSSTSV